MSRRARRLARELALTVGAVLGTVCLLAALASLLFGVKPLIFRSGSMSPAIGTGALAVARTVPVDQLRVGDVVSVMAANGTRVTHRIVAIEPGPVAQLILRGDANRLPDAEAYPVTRADRVLFHVEGLGYLVSGLSAPPVIFLGGLAVGVLVMFAYGPRRSDPSAPVHEETAESPPPVGPTIMTAVLVIAVLCCGRIPTTRAAFTDTATAASGGFAAAALSTPQNLRCTVLGIGAVTLRWDAVSGATRYELIRTPNGGDPITTTTTGTAQNITGLLGSGTIVVRAQQVFDSTTWSSPASGSISYTFVTAVNLCG